MQTLRTIEAPVGFTGGPNEGMEYLAGGQGAIPSLETHNPDNSLPEQAVSRFDLWQRRLANNSIARVAFFALSTGSLVTACAESGDNAALNTTITHEQLAPEVPEQDRHCYNDFAGLSAAEQQECRELIADMDANDINQLSPLDHARWAGYYRFDKLGELRPAQIEIQAVIASQNQSIIHNAANRLLMGHQDNIFRVAWLLQTNPAICADSRTLQAALGSPDMQSESYKMAQSVASTFPADGKQLNDYLIAMQTSSPLFGNVAVDNPKVNKKDSAYELTFQTSAISTARPQQFTFTMFPYMDVWPEGALYKEGFVKDDPALSPEEQKVWAPLKEKLIVSTPKITS